MMKQRIGISEYEKFHSRPCNGHVHAADVGKEANVSFLVGAHETYDYYVALLPLEAVHRVYRNKISERLEKNVADEH